MNKAIVLKFYLLRTFNKMDVAGRAGGWWNLEFFCAGRFRYIIGGPTRLDFLSNLTGLVAVVEIRL